MGKKLTLMSHVIDSTPVDVVDLVGEIMGAMTEGGYIKTRYLSWLPRTSRKLDYFAYEVPTQLGYMSDLVDVINTSLTLELKKRIAIGVYAGKVDKDGDIKFLAEAGLTDELSFSSRLLSCSYLRHSNSKESSYDQDECEREVSEAITRAVTLYFRHYWTNFDDPKLPREASRKISTIVRWHADLIIFDFQDKVRWKIDYLKADA